MRTLRWATCLWPGLPQLWIAGSFSGLAMAVGFALLVDLVLLSTLAWTELLSAGLKWWAWSGVSAFWLVSAWISLRWLKHSPEVSESPADDGLLREAQLHYLAGSWFEAEVALGRLLERSPRDAEARLFMASLYRRSGRDDEAEEQLRLLEKLDGAVKWDMELRHERILLAEARADRESDPSGSDGLPWSDAVIPFAGAA